MTTFGNKKQRDELAAQLKRLRSLSGLSGRELGRVMGVDQSTISRIERGEQSVTLAQVSAWAKATGAADSVDELLALAERVVIGPRSWEDASETGSTNLQAETARLEAGTGLLCIYLPVSVPGLLQTPAYARRLLSSGPGGPPEDLGKRVVDRMERQRVLYDESKRFRFVISEAALRWPYGPPEDPAVPDEHREQLGRIEWAIGRPNIEVGILPLAPLATWRLTGFVLYDETDGFDPEVHLEWLTRPVDFNEPDQVEECRQAFASLMSASVKGDEALRLIAAAAADLR